MYRIDNATAVPSLPTPAPVGPNPDGFFTKGDPNTAQLATIVDDDWLNGIQEELCNVIENSGIVLDKSDRTQLLQAIQTLVNGTPYAVSSSAANTYTASVTPAPVEYTTGMLVLIKFNNTNTGAATLNLNGLGAIPIKRLDGSALVSGDFYSGMVAALVYDGTNFQILNAQIVKPSSVVNNQFSYTEDGGSANTLTGTLTPSPSGYTAGMAVKIKVANANTGASTVNLNGLGAKSINLSSGAALIGGELIAGMIAELIYDGTNFQLLNSSLAGRFIGYQKFTSSGTYTPSAGCRNAKIKAWGAGGGGGCCNTNPIIGGPGGAGAYVEAFVPITGIVTVTIPTGGAGATVNTNNNGGAASGDTSFGTLVVAKSGAHGVGGANGGAGGQGGQAASCTVPTSGFALSGGNGNTSTTLNFTGYRDWGMGGSSPNNTIASIIGAPGDGAANSGQGGAGGTTAYRGGNGGSGYLIVELK